MAESSRESGWIKNGWDYSSRSPRFLIAHFGSTIESVTDIGGYLFPTFSLKDLVL